MFQLPDAGKWNAWESYAINDIVEMHYDEMKVARGKKLTHRKYADRLQTNRWQN